MPETKIVHLLSGLKPERAAGVSFVLGMRGPGHFWTGEDAQWAINLLKALQGPTVSTDNVHENSWDWDRMKAHPWYDPPWFSVTATQVDHIAGVPVEMQTRTALWVWDLEETEDGTEGGRRIVAVREYHGADDYRIATHVNYFVVYRDEIEKVLEQLQARPTTRVTECNAGTLLEMLLTCGKAWILRRDKRARD